jgi:hypothetical protein
MAAQMVKQIELGLRPVGKHGAIPEPAAVTPEHALSRQQTCEHGERPPRRGEMIDSLSHRIDDQLQAVLRGRHKRLPPKPKPGRRNAKSDAAECSARETQSVGEETRRHRVPARYRRGEDPQASAEPSKIDQVRPSLLEPLVSL